jgi:hypothetical protein
MLLGLCFLAGTCFAEQVREESRSRCLQSIEFLTGFSKANLRHGGDYTLVPIIVDFDFNLKPLTEKIDFNPPVLFQFQLEPSISPVTESDANVEIGTGFILKIGLLPETSKFQPYIKGGPGIAYTTQHTREQGTQFNFFQYAGMGMHYFFTKDMAFTVEGRYRHLSNCGIRQPNHGINSFFALLGIAYQF